MATGLVSCTVTRGGGVQTLEWTGMEWTTGMANSLGQLDMQFQPGYEGLIGHSET